jgi:transcriptional regulator with XRE-family HTH domain
MARRIRRTARSDGAREANAIAANLGRDARTTRRQRRMTQAELGEAVGMSQAEISLLESGRGAHTSIETWVAIGIALRQPIAIGFGRDTVQPLSDAAHLDAQELVTRLPREAGWRVAFEAPDDRRAPGGSTDLRLDRPGVSALIEIWNRLDDLGAAGRSSDRKLARAPAGTRPVWLLADTAANHAIVRRYPTVLRSRFPGSSSCWVRALADGGEPPVLPGLAWIDLRAGRLRPRRVNTE